MKTMKTILKKLSKSERQAKREAMRDINNAFGKAHNVANHNASMMFLGAL